jgi:MFS family permease
MQKNKLGSKITLLLTSTGMMACSMLVIPVLGIIAKDFGGQDVSMILTIVPLCMIPGILLAGRLSMFISKKTILIFGTLLFSICAAMGGFLNNLPAIVVTRAFMGFGAGVISMLPNAFIAQLFDGNEKVSLLGAVQAVGYILAVICSAIGGVFGTISWRLCFWIIGAYAFLALFQFIKLPNVPPERTDATLKVEEGQAGEKIDKRVFLFAAAILIGSVITAMFQVSISSFVDGEKLGGSIEAGIVVSLSNLMGLILSIFFSKLFNKLRRYIVVLSPLILAFGLGTLYFAKSMPIVYIAGALCGVPGITFPYYISRLTMVVPRSKQTISISILTTCMFLGQFFTTPYIRLLSALIGLNIRAQFLVDGLLAIALMLAILIYILRTNKTETPILKAALSAEK